MNNPTSLITKQLKSKSTSPTNQIINKPFLSNNILTNKPKMKGISLFSSAGLAETYFNDIGIEIVVANELLEKRAKFYQHLYPNSKMIIGDIRDKKIFDTILTSAIKENAKLLLITPPCQGFSLIGKNKNQKQILADERNFLIFKAIELIAKCNFDYIIIENVPRSIKVPLPFQGSLKTLPEILNDKFSKKYNIESSILNAKDYGVPQNRPRAIIKLYKKKYSWLWPIKQKEITLRQAISHLPSLESGEKSDIKYHEAKVHSANNIKWMRHTPTGCSAFYNLTHYPQKSNGERIKGYLVTYKRMNWDKPAPTRTTNSGNIGSHNNVHPGYLLPDGTYSDARTLTIHELLIISSLPLDWNIPKWASDNLIRQVIGEGVPPLLMKKVLEGIINYE